MGIGLCWLALLLTRLPVVLATVYLDDSVGLSASNVGHVAEVVQYAAAAKRFRVMGGDFNVTPDELRRFFDLEAAGLVIAPPSNVEVMCVQGRGRLTSFFVVSAALQGQVVNCEALEVP